MGEGTGPAGPVAPSWEHLSNSNGRVRLHPHGHARLARVFPHLATLLPSLGHLHKAAVAQQPPSADAALASSGASSGTGAAAGAIGSAAAVAAPARAVATSLASHAPSPPGQLFAGHSGLSLPDGLTLRDMVTPGAPLPHLSAVAVAAGVVPGGAGAPGAKGAAASSPSSPTSSSWSEALQSYLERLDAGTLADGDPCDPSGASALLALLPPNVAVSSYRCGLTDGGCLLTPALAAAAAVSAAASARLQPSLGGADIAAVSTQLAGYQSALTQAITAQAQASQALAGAQAAAREALSEEAAAATGAAASSSADAAVHTDAGTAIDSFDVDGAAMAVDQESVGGAGSDGGSLPAGPTPHAHARRRESSSSSASLSALSGVGLTSTSHPFSRPNQRGGGFGDPSLLAPGLGAYADLAMGSVPEGAACLAHVATEAPLPPAPVYRRVASRVSHDGRTVHVTIPSGDLALEPTSGPAGAFLLPVPSAQPLPPCARPPHLGATASACGGVPLTGRPWADAGPLDDVPSRLASASPSAVGSGAALIGPYACRAALYAHPTCPIDAHGPALEASSLSAPLVWGRDVAPLFRTVTEKVKVPGAEGEGGAGEGEGAGRRRRRGGGGGMNKAGSMPLLPMGSPLPTTAVNGGGGTAAPGSPMAGGFGAPPSPLVEGAMGAPAGAVGSPAALHLPTASPGFAFTPGPSSSSSSSALPLRLSLGGGLVSLRSYDPSAPQVQAAGEGVTHEGDAAPPLASPGLVISIPPLSAHASRHLALTASAAGAGAVASDSSRAALSASPSFDGGPGSTAKAVSRGRGGAHAAAQAANASAAVAALASTAIAGSGPPSSARPALHASMLVWTPGCRDLGTDLVRGLDPVRVAETGITEPVPPYGRYESDPVTGERVLVRPPSAWDTFHQRKAAAAVAAGAAGATVPGAGTPSAEESPAAEVPPSAAAAAASASDPAPAAGSGSPSTTGSPRKGASPLAGSSPASASARLEIDSDDDDEVDEAVMTRMHARMDAMVRRRMAEANKRGEREALAMKQAAAAAKAAAQALQRAPPKARAPLPKHLQSKSKLQLQQMAGAGGPQPSPLTGANLLASPFTPAAPTQAFAGHRSSGGDMPPPPTGAGGGSLHDHMALAATSPQGAPTAPASSKA